MQYLFLTQKKKVLENHGAAVDAAAGATPFTRTTITYELELTSFL